MRSNPTIIHLANVLAIAEADGALSDVENGALHDIMFRIGADEADLDAARALLTRGEAYPLQAFSDPVTNMQMIENMVLVALADGQVSPYESQPLEAFLSGLGFAQADMDMIVKRVRVRLRGIQPYRPPAPPAPRERRRTFGRVPAPAVPVAPPPVPSPVPSSVLSPGGAPREAPPPERRPPPPPTEDDARQPPGATAPTPQPASSLDACAAARGASTEGACYCFGRPEGPLNPWGCRLLEMPWSAGAPWFRLGRFRDDDTFVFDRQAIAACLGPRLRAVADCPFLLPGFAEASLAFLPSRASTAGRWIHHLAPRDSAVPVIIRTYRHGCGQHAAARSDGLSPTDDRDARLMIRRTVRRLRAPVDLARLDGRTGGPT